MSLGWRVIEATQHPYGHLLLEPARLGLTLGNWEAWHEIAVLEVDLTALGDQQSVVAGLGMLTKEMPHLSGTLKVELVGVELETVGIVQRRRGLNAQQSGVRCRIVSVGVVQVIGGHQGQVKVFREPQQVVHGALLDVYAVIHDLGIEIACAEDVAEVGGSLSCFFVLP